MFVKKWILCVFSYNRGVLLLNLVQSAKLFYPEFTIVIFDDNSNDPTTLSTLNDMAQSGVEVRIGLPNEGDSKHGGLYAQMNVALQYATEQHYHYAYFVQDDMQFLWRDEKLENKVTGIFLRQECVMCNSSFLQKILFDGLGERLPEVDPGLFSFMTNGVADTGIINLTKAKEIDLSFPEQSEGGNGKHWFNKGYRLYWLPVPHLAWVPWPTTFRNKQKQQRQVRVLKPLSYNAIEKLLTNHSYAFLEDYTSLDSFLPKPYWYSANPGALSLLKIYIKYYLKRITG